MMVAMDPTCEECGGSAEFVRARYLIPLPGSRVVAEDVPSVRCGECELTAPAPHVLTQLGAVLELAEDALGATARKSFAGVPLRPGEKGA